jgi:hypothetical protein
MRKRFRELQKEFPEIAFEQLPGGHVRIRLPTGGSLIMASSPSDKRALYNVRARIKRALREVRQ